MKKFNFDQVIERKNTSCYKWDFCDQRFGGKDLLPFWVADMDFAAPPHVAKIMQERAAHDVYGYTFTPQSLGQSIVKWNQKRHNWVHTPQNIVYSTGVVPSLIIALHAYTKPHDKVIIQSPVYYPFFEIVPKNERQLIINPLSNNNDYYEMDFDHLRSIIKDCKLFILCSPHNPVGRVWRKEELLTLGKICLENNVIIVSDEIHADLVFSGHKHLPLASLSEELAQNTITCMAPSKTFNIAGLMLSYVIIQNPKLKKSYEDKREALGHISNNPFAIAASEVAYTQGEEWLDELLRYLEGNIDFIERTLKKDFPQITMRKPEATYLAWLNMKGLKLDDQMLDQKLLEDCHLAISDGKSFGPQGLLYRRFNFACPCSLLELGFKQMLRLF